jgi:hypothetical protein
MLAEADDILLLVSLEDKERAASLHCEAIDAEYAIAARREPGFAAFCLVLCRALEVLLLSNTVGALKIRPRPRPRKEIDRR